MKQTSKTIMFLFILSSIIILISQNVLSYTDFENNLTGLTPLTTSASVTNREDGFKFNVTQTIVLINSTMIGGVSNPQRCLLYNATNTTNLNTSIVQLLNISATSFYCVWGNYTLYNDTTYIMVAGSWGTNYNLRYTSPFGSFPLTQNNRIKILGHAYRNVPPNWNIGTTEAYNFLTIYTALPDIINISSIIYNVTTSNTPNNLSTSTLNLTINANITSNMNITSDGNATLFYTINTSLNSGCNKFYQNVCQNFGTYMNTSMSQLTNSTFTTSLQDNEILAGYYPFDYDFMRSNATEYLETVYNNNHILFNVTNFSTQLNYTLNMEFQAVNKTNVFSNLLIYYCNSSYISNPTNPTTNINCELVETYSALRNCSHYHGNKCDRSIPVIIQSIKKTQQSYFIFVGQSIEANGWDFSYVLNNSYNNASFRHGSFLQFNSDTTKTPNIFQIHLHSYDTTTDHFKYFVSYSNNGTSVNSTVKNLFYNISYTEPTSPNFINPNCLNTSTAIYTIGSSNNYTFIWSKSLSQLSLGITYSLFESDLLDLSRTNLGNTTNTNITLNSSVMNSISSGLHYLYIYAYDGIGSDFSKSDCTFNMCTNNWVKTVQPCITNAKLINYTDSSLCNEQFNIPVDNGLYEYCNETIYQQTVYTDDILILLILAFFIIVSTICAIAVHEAFFGLNALLVAMVWVVFLTYDYPSILLYVTPFIIIVFSGMWVLVSKVKR